MTSQSRQQIIAAVRNHDPSVLLMKRYDYETIQMPCGSAFVMFCGDRLACRLVGKCAAWLVRRDKALWWSMSGAHQANLDWVLLAPLPPEELIHWATAAMVQAGIELSCRHPEARAWHGGFEEAALRYSN